MITITQQVNLTTGTAGRRRVSTGRPKPKPVTKPHIPRIAKLMALAIRFDSLLRERTVSSQSELAELAHVTQPRMTQILNLNHLAPDIQEELLHLPPITSGKDPIHEKMLRPVAAEINWMKQRAKWRQLAQG
jgi:hypothetical protein